MAEPAKVRNPAAHAKQKAELFAYLDEVCGAKKYLEEISAAEVKQELHQVRPARTPPHIWMYWHSGWEDAPEITKLCRKSWELFNPEYTVHALDHSSAMTFPEAGTVSLPGQTRRLTARGAWV